MPSHHVLGHGCVAKHKRWLAKMCTAAQACLDSTFNSIMTHFPVGRDSNSNRTINVAAVDNIDKMEITLIFKKKEKWKTNLTVERALFLASELEVDH